MKLDVVVEEGKRIIVYVDDQPPIIWDWDSRTFFDIGPTSTAGPCGVFCTTQNETIKFFGFETEILK